MQRENRYLVIKLKELSALSDGERGILWGIAAKLLVARKRAGKKPLQCVVVESDWPEYEKVWEMISARIDAEKRTLLGWTLEEFAVAAEVYRTETGKGPLSTLEGALEVQAHYIATHGTAEVLPELHLYHAVPVDLGWARALFSKAYAALEEAGALRPV